MSALRRADGKYHCGQKSSEKEPARTFDPALQKIMERGHTDLPIKPNILRETM